MCVFWPNAISSDLTFLKSVGSSQQIMSFQEIAYVSIVAVGLAVAITVSSQHKILSRFARRCGITNKFGELDVWGYTFNLKEVVWVTVRDHKNDLVYDGWVQAFSNSSKEAEMLLRDVSVCKNSSAERLYQVGALYISRKAEEISIECRTIPIDDRVKWKGDESDG
jgi:hypothetical protein